MRTASALLLAGLVLAGCSGESSTPTPTPIFEPSTAPASDGTSTPTPTASSPADESPSPVDAAGDVTTFPTSLDDFPLARAQAVVDALDRLHDDIALQVVAEGGVGAEATQRIQAYAAFIFEERFRSRWANDFAERVDPDPQPMSSTVLEVLRFDPVAPCVSLRVVRDHDPMFAPGQELDLTWLVALFPKDPDDAAAATFNPTGFEEAVSYADIPGADVPCDA